MYITPSKSFRGVDSDQDPEMIYTMVMITVKSGGLSTHTQRLRVVSFPEGTVVVRIDGNNKRRIWNEPRHPEVPSKVAKKLFAYSLDVSTESDRLIRVPCHSLVSYSGYWVTASSASSPALGCHLSLKENVNS
jgi:predicted RNA-binding protein YlxR (DUF448 family)